MIHRDQEAIVERIIFDKNNNLNIVKDRETKTRKDKNVKKNRDYT